MQQELDATIANLQKGKSILYPTDTVWGIGCDATNVNAVKNIYQIKNRKKGKNFILLVSSISMLENYTSNIPVEIKEYLSQNKKPITVIYKNPKNLASNVIAIDNSIAIRVVSEGFVYNLIKNFGKPIVSTSANTSGFATPTIFETINKHILDSVDYIVSLKPKNPPSQPSKIIQFINNKIVVLRD